MITIDGSMGEGGGQLVRSALALAVLTQTPIHLTKIRANRARGGLRRQHLCAVNAAAAISGAEVDGAQIGSAELTFQPKGVRSGDYAFEIGSAGSTTLVLQTVLFPLLLGGDRPSTVSFEGGTHNPLAPPFEFLEHAFLPIVRRMGGHVEMTFERHGFYPAGGGRFSVTIHPTRALDELLLLERGAVRKRHATAIVAKLPPSIATRELDTLRKRLHWEPDELQEQVVSDSLSPGNALFAFVESEHVAEVFAGIGQRGVRAETVAEHVAVEVERYLDANVPVFEHLADQLVLPMALGKGGAFRTVRPTLHLTTHVDLLKMFMGDTRIDAIEEAADIWRIEVHRPSAGTSSY